MNDNPRIEAEATTFSFQQTLQQIMQVLGPSVPTNCENHCSGCKWERAEVLRLLRAAEIEHRGHMKQHESLVKKWRNLAESSELRGGTATSLCADELEAELSAAAIVVPQEPLNMSEIATWLERLASDIEKFPKVEALFMQEVSGLRNIASSLRASSGIKV